MGQRVYPGRHLAEGAGLRVSKLIKTMITPHLFSGATQSRELLDLLVVASRRDIWGLQEIVGFYKEEVEKLPSPSSITLTVLPKP